MAEQRVRWAKVSMGDTYEYGEIIDTVEGSLRPFIVQLYGGHTYPFATIHAVDDATVAVLEQREALLHFVRHMTDATEGPAALERCRALGLDL